MSYSSSHIKHKGHLFLSCPSLHPKLTSAMSQGKKRFNFQTTSKLQEPRKSLKVGYLGGPSIP